MADVRLAAASERQGSDPEALSGVAPGGVQEACAAVVADVWKAAGEANGQAEAVASVDAAGSADAADADAQATTPHAAATHTAAPIARCSRTLLSLLESLLASPPDSSASSSSAASRLPALAGEGHESFFASCEPSLVGDDACAPLVSCLRRLRDLAERGGDGCAGAPAWLARAAPLRVRAHGNLHGDNVLVDTHRRLHLQCFDHSRLASPFFDLAALLPHVLLSSARVADDAALHALCEGIDVLLLPNGVDNPPCDSLLVHCAVALPDVLPESTPVALKAALVMAQQMIDGACKMAVAAAMQLGHLDEHDLHPVHLLLPLVLHCVRLCHSDGLAPLQQRAAWHMALRAARAITTFVDGTPPIPGRAARRTDPPQAKASADARAVATDVADGGEGHAAPEPLSSDEATAKAAQSRDPSSAPAADASCPAPVAAPAPAAAAPKKPKATSGGKTKRQGSEGKKTKRTPAKS